MPPKRSERPLWSKGSKEQRKSQRKPEISVRHEDAPAHGAKLPANGARRSTGFINGFSTIGRINGLKGRVNGLKGRVNGLKNGRRGLYNGLVNGLDRRTGWINGNGFINGFRLTNFRHAMPLQRRSFSLRIAAVIVMAAVIILVPFYLVSTMPESTIKIDGYFFDWERAGYFQEKESTAQPSIDIREYSIVIWRNTVYCYISTTAPMFSLSEDLPQAFYALFDTDNDQDTGYMAEGIGADLIVEILGWNGSMQLSRLSEFTTHADRKDFSGFIGDMPVKAMVSGNQLEFSFTKAHIENPTVRFFAKNGYGSEDTSLYAVRYMAPALRATIDLTMPEILIPGSMEAVLALELKGQRGDVEISGLSFQKLGNASEFRLFLYDGATILAESEDINLTFAQPLIVEEGYGKTLSLFVEVDGIEITSSFGLSLQASGIITEDGPVSIEEKQTLAKVAYVGEIPTEVIIDGAFADWANGYIMLDADGDVQFEDGTIMDDESIDIIEYGMYVGREDLAMYLSVDDRICNGTLLPKDIHLPVPSAGLPSLESPELIGADIAGAIIDIDLNASTGSNMNDVMGADYLVFITGKKGMIILSELYIWSENGDGSWEFVDTVRSAVDNRRMEFAFNMSHLALNSTNIASVGFFMTDWEQGTDYSDSLLPVARWQSEWYEKAFGGIIINEVFHVRNELAWIELYNTGTQPISLSGWTLYDDRTVIWSFGDVILSPGEFLLIEGLNLDHIADIRLVDDQGVVIDIRIVEKGSWKSYSRTGDPPYSKWKLLMPTPGELNIGQTAIPEFSSIMLPILGVIVLLLVFRTKKRRATYDH